MSKQRKEKSIKRDKIKFVLSFLREQKREGERKRREEGEEEEEEKKRTSRESKGMELYGILKFCMDFHEIVWISMELYG